MEITVVTGFGYYTEVATGHIVAKVSGLTAGTYTIASGYTFTEVEDQAALDAIDVYLAPPVPEMNVLMDIDNPIDMYIDTINPTGVSVSSVFQNTSGAALIIQGFLDSQGENTTARNASLEVQISETEEGFGNAEFIQACLLARNAYPASEVLRHPVCFFVPKNYWVKIILGHTCTGSGDVLTRIELYKMNLIAAA